MLIANVILLIAFLSCCNGQSLVIQPGAADCFTADTDDIKLSPASAFPNFNLEQCQNACLQTTDFTCAAILYFDADFGCVVFSSAATDLKESASDLGGNYFLRKAGCTASAATTTQPTTTPTTTTPTTTTPTTTPTTTSSSTAAPTTSTTAAAATTQPATTPATSSVTAAAGFFCNVTQCQACPSGACPSGFVPFSDAASCVATCGVTTTPTAPDTTTPTTPAPTTVLTTPAPVATTTPTASLFTCVNGQCQACAQGSCGAGSFASLALCSSACVQPVKYYCSNKQCVTCQGASCPQDVSTFSTLGLCSPVCEPAPIIHYYCDPSANFQCSTCNEKQCPSGVALYTTPTACSVTCKPQPVIKYYCADQGGCTACDLNSDCPVGKVVHDDIGSCRLTCETTLYYCLNGQCRSCKQGSTCPSNVPTFVDLTSCERGCTPLGTDIQFYCLFGKCQECRISEKDCPDHIARFSSESQCDALCVSATATSGCFDVNQHCQWHASQGQCTANKPAMERDCNATCGFCNAGTAVPPIPPGTIATAAPTVPTTPVLEVTRYICQNDQCSSCLSSQCPVALVHFPDESTCQSSGCGTATDAPATQPAATAEPTWFFCSGTQCSSCLRSQCPANVAHHPTIDLCSAECPEAGNTGGNVIIAPPIGSVPAGACIDRHRLCSYWARELNECSLNQDWMSKNCAGACSNCSPRQLITDEGCVDTTGENGLTCTDYINADQCTAKKDYMFWRCPVSCNFCDLTAPPP